MDHHQQERRLASLQRRVERADLSARLVREERDRTLATMHDRGWSYAHLGRLVSLSDVAIVHIVKAQRKASNDDTTNTAGPTTGAG